MPRPKASLAVLTGLCVVALLVACSDDEGSTSQASASAPAALVTSPGLVPGFSWKQSDYVVRCRNVR